MWYLEVYLQNCQLSTETGGARGVFALQLVAEQATQYIYIYIYRYEEKQEIRFPFLAKLNVLFHIRLLLVKI